MYHHKWNEIIDLICKQLMEIHNEPTLDEKFHHVKA